MAEAAPPTPPAAPRALARVPGPVAIGAVVMAVGLATRIWIRAGAAPLVWNDSADYLASSKAPLLSMDRLAGLRPLLLPSVLGAVGQDLTRLVQVQEVAAAVAWGLLAAAAASTVQGVGRQAGAATAVLALSLAWPISMWDQVVLTESTALTTFALFAAAGLSFASRQTPARAALLVAAAALWLVARDSHVVPVAATGLLLLGLACRRATAGRRLLALTGAYLVALGLLISGAAQYGHRDRQPVEHVYAVRVLPYHDRVAWFARHGMPDAPALEAVPEAVDLKLGLAPYTPIPPDPRWARWRRWLATDGRRTYLAYVASHPTYVVTEPSRQPERVFNNVGGLAGYRPLALREVPLLATLAYPPSALALSAAALGALVLVVRRRTWGPLAWTGAVLVLTWIPHVAVVWHSDGMESTRHLLLPGVQLRTGALLLVLAALTSSEDAATGTDPSRPARWPDPPPAPHPDPA